MFTSWKSDKNNLRILSEPHAQLQPAMLAFSQVLTQAIAYLRNFNRKKISLFVVDSQAFTTVC